MNNDVKPIPRPPINISKRRALEEVDVPDPRAPLKSHAPSPPPRMAPDEEIGIADERSQPPPPPQSARPTPTFTIHALIDDFPFEVHFSGSADQLIATVKRLRELGAIPPTPAARAAIAAEAAREAPVCPYHGPMKESTKAPGSWYCTKKMGDGSFCKERG